MPGPTTVANDFAQDKLANYGSAPKPVNLSGFDPGQGVSVTSTTPPSAKPTIDQANAIQTKAQLGQAFTGNAKILNANNFYSSRQTKDWLAGQGLSDKFTSSSDRQLVNHALNGTAGQATLDYLKGKGLDMSEAIKNNSSTSLALDPTINKSGVRDWLKNNGYGSYWGSGHDRRLLRNVLQGKGTQADVDYLTNQGLDVRSLRAFEQGKTDGMHPKFGQTTPVPSIAQQASNLITADMKAGADAAGLGPNQAIANKVLTTMLQNYQNLLKTINDNLIAWQKEHNLTADGKLGTNTYNAMKAAGLSENDIISQFGGRKYFNKVTPARRLAASGNGATQPTYASDIERRKAAILAGSASIKARRQNGTLGRPIGKPTIDLKTLDELPPLHLFGTTMYHTGYTPHGLQYYEPEGAPNTHYLSDGSVWGKGRNGEWTRSYYKGKPRTWRR